jgi:hypothetical protein
VREHQEPATASARDGACELAKASVCANDALRELFAVFIPSRGDIPPVSLTTARGAIGLCKALHELGHTDADYYRYTCEHSDGWDH